MSETFSPPFRYQLYGLSVTSNLPLRHLIARTDSGSSDLAIEFRVVETHRTPPAERDTVHQSSGVAVGGEPFFEVWRGEPSRQDCLGAQYTDGTGHATFLIDCDASRVRVHWTETLVFEDVVSYLLGPILGVILCLRGLTPIHAGAAVVDGRALVLVGPSGVGKSTLLAALASRGHRVLSDDLVPLSRRNGRYLVSPGYSRLRLWSPTVDSLPGFETDALSRVLTVVEKRYLNLSPDEGVTDLRFESTPRPLAALCFLGQRLAAPGHVISPLKARDSLLGLLRNTYADYLLDKQDRARDFEKLKHVALAVPCLKVDPVNNLGELDSLCEGIVDSVRRLEETWRG